MPSATQQVASVFTQAQSLATAATTAANTMVANLNAINYSLPTINVAAGTMPAAPTITLPTAPSLTAVVFNEQAKPGSLSIAEPTSSIDDFTEVDPTLSLPTAPTVTYGSIPTIPSIANIPVPDAPTVTMPALPTYMALNTVTFGGVDLHADWLTKLETIPTLNIVEPTPYSHNVNPAYTSALLESMSALLDARLNGGTGLPSAVEQAIWDRSRDRETSIAQSNIDEVMRKSETLGFKLPTGALSAQLRQAEQAYYDKLSELSRDVAVKQAELEQENLKQTIAAGIQLEGQLIDHCYKLEQLTFENAKTYADNSIQVYNAQVENYKALLQSYTVYADAYKTVIQAELSKVEVYKAELQAEQTKVNVNVSLVEQYKAQIEAGMSAVKIFEAQVAAAQTLVELERAKIGAAGEQIQAYVAQVNAETAKVEAYKAQITGEMSKVEIYKSKAQVFSYKVNAQAEKARADLGRYTALVQAKSAEWEGYKAAVSAEGERVRAVIGQNSTLVDAYKATATAAEAAASAHARTWEAGIKQYEAQQTITLQTAKANTEALIATNSARADAAKVGAQVYAQWASSAYSMMHAQASISGNDATSVSYQVPVAQVSAPPSFL